MNIVRLLCASASVAAILAMQTGLAEAAEETAAAKGQIVKFDPGPVFQGDGWEFRIIGRVQMDYNFVDTDNAGAEWSATELRRLRLGVSGKYGDNLKYKMELNTDSAGEVDVEDAYLQWAPTSGPWSVKIGQYKTPNSLDSETSSRFISTLERAAFTNAFDINRRLGVGVEVEGEKYSFFAGAFGDNLNEMSAQEGYALASRLVVTPVKEDGRILHLGATVRYRDIGDTQSDIRYRQRPFSHEPGRILSTGNVARSDFYVSAEAAAVLGRMWAAGEYARTFVNCSAAAETALRCVGDPSIDGAYGEVGVFFGGAKGYKGGKFDRPHVDHPVTEGGAGALSLVARFDRIDLDSSGIDGGSYNSYILGADWWATRYTRLGVNLFKVDADLGASTSGLDPAFAALVTGLTPSEDATGVVVRAQFDF